MDCILTHCRQTKMKVKGLPFFNKITTYPAAIIILNTTSCQNSLTVPQRMIAMPKTAVHTVNIRTRLYLSAAKPNITPITVKTAIKLGPARI